MKRLCIYCNKAKDIEQFHNKKSNKDSKDTRCKECMSSYHRKLYYKDIEKSRADRRKQYTTHKNKEKYIYARRNWKLKNRYGISLKEKEDMQILQNNRCAICKNIFKSEKDTCVDHDHKTKKIRKLLCNNCNIGIGAFLDNSNFLIAASQYLLDFAS